VRYYLDVRMRMTRDGGVIVQHTHPERAEEREYPSRASRGERIPIPSEQRRENIWGVCKKYCTIP